jgi:hypothetical protein
MSASDILAKSAADCGTLGAETGWATHVSEVQPLILFITASSTSNSGLFLAATIRKASS